MQIFHYHPDTGAYLGHGMADESPLEPGVWLIPAHATSEAPPEHGEGQQAVMVEGAWQVLPMPEPEPEPEPAPLLEPEPAAEMTTAKKLARFGFTVDELRALFAQEVTP